MKPARTVWMTVLGCVFLAGGLWAEETPPSTNARVPGAPSFKGVTYRYLNDETGACVGKIRIGRVDLEYRQQGFLRIAWRPLVVLEQVDFDIGADLMWPVHGSQMSRSLQELGGRDELVLRKVHVHLAGPETREIVAATARFLPGGVLEFHEATVTAAGVSAGDEATGAYRLQLTGPQAGRLARFTAVTTADARKKISSTNTLPQ